MFTAASQSTYSTGVLCVQCLDCFTKSHCVYKACCHTHLLSLSPSLSLSLPLSFSLTPTLSLTFLPSFYWQTGRRTPTQTYRRKKPTKHTVPTPHQTGLWILQIKRDSLWCADICPPGKGEVPQCVSRIWVKGADCGGKGMARVRGGAVVMTESRNEKRECSDVWVTKRSERETCRGMELLFWKFQNDFRETVPVGVTIGPEENCFFSGDKLIWARVSDGM